MCQLLGRWRGRESPGQHDEGRAAEGEAEPGPRERALGGAERVRIPQPQVHVRL